MSWFTWSLKTVVEIEAQPTAVRSKFLDFSSVASYSPNGFIKSVAPSNGIDFTPSQPITVNLTMGTFKSTVITNNPEEFAWRGSLPGIFTGTHHFRFEPSERPGHTRFVQEEFFTGALAWMMGESWVARLIGFREQTRTNWEGLNRDLKAELEK